MEFAALLKIIVRPFKHILIVVNGYVCNMIHPKLGCIMHECATTSTYSRRTKLM